MFLLKFIRVQAKKFRIQTNKCSSAIKIFIAFVVTPPLKIMEFFVNLGGYDKGFYGIYVIYEIELCYSQLKEKNLQNLMSSFLLKFGVFIICIFNIFS